MSWTSRLKEAVIMACDAMMAAKMAKTKAIEGKHSLSNEVKTH
jgi:hypothetical protein